MSVVQVLYVYITEKLTYKYMNDSSMLDIQDTYSTKESNPQYIPSLIIIPKNISKQHAALYSLSSLYNPAMVWLSFNNFPCDDKRLPSRDQVAYCPEITDSQVCLTIGDLIMLLVSLYCDC